MDVITAQQASCSLQPASHHQDMLGRDCLLTCYHLNTWMLTLCPVVWEGGKKSSTLTRRILFCSMDGFGTAAWIDVGAPRAKSCHSGRGRKWAAPLGHMFMRKHLQLVVKNMWYRLSQRAETMCCRKNWVVTWTGSTKGCKIAQSVMQRCRGRVFCVGQDRFTALVYRSLETHIFSSHQTLV